MLLLTCSWKTILFLQLQNFPVSSDLWCLFNKKASEIPLSSVFLFSQESVNHKPTLLSHQDCWCTSADKLWKFWLPKNHLEPVYFLLLEWCLPPTGKYRCIFTHIHQGFLVTSRSTSNQSENTTLLMRHNVTACCSFQYHVNMQRNNFLVP